MADSVHRVLNDRNWTYFDLKTYLERDASSINDLGHIQGVTPLHRVLMSDKCTLEVVILLLQYGADVNLVSRISSALFIALMYHKSKDIIQILLEAGADVNAIDEYYIMPPLCMALRSGASAEVIEMLLDWGCPIDNSGEYSSMLHCASYYELRADVCKLLLDAGAGDVRKLDRYGESVLCYALRKGTELEALKMLIGAGCSLRACMQHESAWLCATSYSSMLRGDILKVLLLADINITPVNEHKETPLQCALRYCIYETSAIELLFNLQVGKVAKSSRDKMLLLDAASNYACKLSTVKFLLARKVELNVVDKHEDTALHLMLRYNSCSPDIIKYLLEKGIPVNLKNCCGDTPLKIAVEKAQKKSILELLLKNGAYIQMPNDNKLSMLRFIFTQYAYHTRMHPTRGEEYRDILKMFLKYAFLENISFQIERINWRIDLNYEFFWRFARKCVCELQDMKLRKIGYTWVLHDLIDRDLDSKMDIVLPDDSNSEEETYDFKLFLEVLAKNKYPVYFDVISSSIDRNEMLYRLEEVRMYTVVAPSPEWPCAQRKVFLNYDCVRMIAELLTEIDLLNFMIAYFFPNISNS